VLVDLNGRAYDLPGDIILAGVQIAAPQINFCHGITHLQLIIELGYRIKPQSQESALRTNGRRRLFIPEAIGGLFKVGRDRDNNDIASL